MVSVLTGIVSIRCMFNPRSLDSKTPVIPLYNSSHLCKLHILIRCLLLGVCLWARHRKTRDRPRLQVGISEQRQCTCHNKNVGIKITLSDFLSSSSKHFALNLYLLTFRFIFQAPSSVQNSKWLYQRAHLNTELVSQPALHHLSKWQFLSSSSSSPKLWSHPLLLFLSHLSSNLSTNIVSFTFKKHPQCSSFPLLPPESISSSSLSGL